MSSLVTPYMYSTYGISEFELYPMIFAVGTLYFSYAASAVPSFAGLGGIYTAKLLTLVAVVFDFLYKLYILVVKGNLSIFWTVATLCVKRIMFEILINLLYIFTQAVPGINWILNLIPLVASTYNLFSS